MPRPPSGGERGRVPAATATAIRVHRPGPPALSRSAPTVLRAADLRAIIAGRRGLPGAEEELQSHRSYPPRQQVVNITYSVRQEVAAPAAPQPAEPAATETLGARLAHTAGRISAAAAGVEEANPLFTRDELRAAVERGETVSQAQMVEAEKRHAMAIVTAR